MLGVGGRNSDSSHSIQTTEFIQNYQVSVSTVDDSGQWMTVYFWVPGLINSPQSHIMMSVMQDLTSLVFSVCGMTCRRFGCGDGIREEGLRDDYLELKFYTVLRA
ncbi:hypothetical protein TNCV_2761 [Trichonephila clavipes]|nr:hypothetical protein TNCV_2761 [Trichonephila clavipes]